jgi:ATP-dependent Lhr-like helicase
LAEIICVPAREVFKALVRIEASGAALRGVFEGEASPGSDFDIEWCDRRLLARIHRLTLGTLRKQVQPVTAAVFMSWLFRWQHVAPGTQMHGTRGLEEAVRQLQGFEVPANAWEPQILTRRVSGYSPEQLDQLCLQGTVGWGRLSPHPATLDNTNTGERRIVPTSVAPITLFARDDADWMRSKRGDSSCEEFARGLSPTAQKICSHLRSRGAVFFPELVRAFEKHDPPILKAEIETALWELVAAGVVTADGFDNLRSLIDPKRRKAANGKRALRPRNSVGRWCLLHTEDSISNTQMLEATCRMLLKRYGVVFRELLARESILPKWRELLVTFRRLEDRGEVRGGRFVSGFLGEQFALPEAVDGLRAFRKSVPEDELITVSASDPLNLVGIIVPGERVPAVSGKYVTFRGGSYVTGEAAATKVAVAGEAP